MKKTKVEQEINYKALFESLPGSFLILSPNNPNFTIVAVSDAYLDATMTIRSEIVGRDLFEVFPDNPNDLKSNSTTNLRNSLMTVIQQKAPHVMDVQKYDIQRPISEGGGFEVRYWNPNNSPLIENGEIKYIVHKVMDVTNHVKLIEKGIEETKKAKDELEEKILLVKNNEDRINHILNILLKYTTLDFSEQIETTNKGDELDSIAIGLNTLGNELKHHINQIGIEQEKITQANDFLNAILENIPNMVFVKDAKEFRFIRFNKAGEELLGFKREDLLGKNDYDFFPKEQADFFVGKDRETVESGELTNIEEEVVKTANGNKWLHTKKIPMLGANGTPAYLLGISEDITESKKQREQLIEVNKELESFSYSISHDLRAPLRAIHGYTKILEEDYYNKLDDEGKKTISAVLRNSKRMGELIDDLLSFSRLGKKELSTSLTDMNIMVHEVCNEIISKDTRIKLNLKIGQLIPSYTDHMLIRQVWTNLISNAVKFSMKNNSIDIEIGCKVDKNMNEYYVKDNGAGFDMHYADKLFGVFQRLHSQEEFDGTGVGLAIVKRILNKHHGTIRAESILNKGSIFYFSLPFTNENLTAQL